VPKPLVIQEFAQRGRLRQDFNLYTLYHPAIDNQGRATTGYSTTYNEEKMLVAKNSTSGHASAIASSLPYAIGCKILSFVKNLEKQED
jgi:hypothetical protein